MKDWFMVDGVKCHFEQYFSYIMVVSFIGGGNQSTWKKTTDLSQVTDKLYHIINVVSSTPSHERGWNLEL